jgi:hypothetical protein
MTEPLTAALLAAALLLAACGSDGTRSEANETDTVKPRTLAATEPREIRLGNVPTIVRLAAPSGALPSAGSLWLTVEGLKPLRKGAFFQVYLNLPEGQKPDPKGPHFVGNISLYGMDPESEEGADQTFDVTDELRELRAAGLWTEELRVTFVRGNPGRGASPADELVSFRRVLLERR